MLAIWRLMTNSNLLDGIFGNVLALTAGANHTIRAFNFSEVCDNGFCQTLLCDCGDSGLDRFSCVSVLARVGGMPTGRSNSSGWPMPSKRSADRRRDAHARGMQAGRANRA